MDWIMTDDTDGRLRISLRGDCDLYEAPAFQRAMLSLLESETRSLRFDFAHVAYLDSSGVGAIIRIVQAARQKARSLTFCGICGTPRRVLQMANILGLLTEEDRLEVAK